MLKFMRSLAAFARGGTTGLQPLEMHVLSAIGHTLDEGMAARLSARIQSINLVQRLDGGREVNTYAMAGGKPSFDDHNRMTATDGEAKLADFFFTSTDGRRFEGSAWLVNGQLFSLEFDNPTEHILNEFPNDLRVVSASDLSDRVRL